jgi:tRNA nucleotidyltransferase (CCA-adding enzyme)
MAMPCVMGADLIQAGFQPGKAFKIALDYAHKLHLAGTPKETALKQTIAYLKKIKE